MAEHWETEWGWEEPDSGSISIAEIMKHRMERTGSSAKENTRGFLNGDMFRENGKVFIHFSGKFYNLNAKRPMPRKDIHSDKKTIPDKAFIGNLSDMIKGILND